MGKYYGVNRREEEMLSMLDRKEKLKVVNKEYAKELKEAARKDLDPKMRKAIAEDIILRRTLDNTANAIEKSDRREEDYMTKRAISMCSQKPDQLKESFGDFLNFLPEILAIGRSKERKFIEASVTDIPQKPKRGRKKGVKNGNEEVQEGSQGSNGEQAAGEKSPDDHGEAGLAQK